MNNIFLSGGSKGIGLECLKKFSQNKSKVVFTYTKALEKNFFTKNNLDNKYVIPFKFNSLKFNDYKKINIFLKKNKISKINTLINNVGDVLKRTSFEESDFNLWVNSFNINLFSSIKLTQVLLPYIKKTKNSSIINVSSVAAKTTGSPDSLHYGVAKSALNTFTLGLSREMSIYPIRVIAIAPSAVNTNFQKKYSSNRRLKKIINKTSLNRIAEPYEIANIIYSLSNKDHSYINGTIVEVDGGRLA